MTKPQDITVDTTMQEIWDTFAQDVLHLTPYSPEYTDFRVIFFAGAVAALGWSRVASRDTLTNAAYTQEFDRVDDELQTAIRQFIAERLAEEQAS